MKVAVSLQAMGIASAVPRSGPFPSPGALRAVILAWSVVSFLIALRIFHWT